MEFRSAILTHEDEPLLPFASRTVLEVTERAQLSSTQDLAETVQVRRAAGYRIALDDLGEGYAGLSWLVKLTPDIAKLDMSLVAEGVETAAEEEEVLSDLGCELLQG